MKNKSFKEEWKVIYLGSKDDISDEGEEPWYWKEPWIEIWKRTSPNEENVVRIESDIYISIPSDLIFEKKKDIDLFIFLLKKAKKYLKE